MRRLVSLILSLVLLTGALHAQSVGLVLSGGGAKGITHIGIIQALEENDIPIDYISGTSMGAIVASLYSMGYTPDEMIQVMKSDDFQRWYTGSLDQDYMYYFKKNKDVPDLFSVHFSFKDSIRVVPEFSNIVNATPMNLGFLEIFAGSTAACKGNFDNLMIPFRCVASDIYNKNEVVFSKGDLGDAVRASMTYPFFFRPIKVDSVLLYDGGLYNNFPSDVMQKDFNPDIVIGTGGYVCAPSVMAANAMNIPTIILNMVMMKLLMLKLLKQQNLLVFMNILKNFQKNMIQKLLKVEAIFHKVKNNLFVLQG